MKGISGLLLVMVTLIAVFVACKKKKNNDVFPVLDVIKSEIAHVDSSVDPIVKLTPKTDSTFDTAFIDRKAFNALAQEFTETPDISRNLPGKYAEQRIMDNELGQAVFIATTDDKTLEVQREEIRIVPNPPNDEIKSIYIEKFKAYGDSSVTKRLTWYAGKKFQIISIVENKQGEEKNSVVNVIWNDRE